jgi:hypothetical protein
VTKWRSFGRVGEPLVLCVDTSQTQGPVAVAARSTLAHAGSDFPLGGSPEGDALVAAVSLGSDSGALDVQCCWSIGLDDMSRLGSRGSGKQQHGGQYEMDCNPEHFYLLKLFSLPFAVLGRLTVTPPRCRKSAAAVSAQRHRPAKPTGATASSASGKMGTVGRWGPANRRTAKPGLARQRRCKIMQFAVTLSIPLSVILQKSNTTFATAALGSARMAQSKAPGNGVAELDPVPVCFSTCRRQSQDPSACADCLLFERPFWAYSVEKLCPAQIASKTWEAVLIRRQLANVVCRGPPSKEDVVHIWPASVKK